MVLSWATRSFPVRCDGGMDSEKGGTKELWERLDNEPANAFAAFGCLRFQEPLTDSVQSGPVVPQRIVPEPVGVGQPLYRERRRTVR